MKIDKNLRDNLTFGFEQTFTIENWWSEPGFSATSDTALKREKMLELAQALAQVMQGKYIESKDIWGHLQYETFDANGNQSFYVTMDPGSIEVKTPPCLYDDLEKMIKPLFLAAELSQLVPYRNWWYGVQGGTEGGCHVNMGGFENKSNPLKQNPDLLVKYCAYIHNRPFLHYPFMGLDVGPGGNCQRMDEKEGYDLIKKAFDNFKEGSLDATEIYPYFEKTNLINDKSSFPSLKKFKAPDFFIEDRAQEALRSPEEFELVAKKRLIILSELLKSKLETLKSFNNLHDELLTSYYLWGEFQEWANKREINPVPYQRFFDRQFPRIFNGNPPSKFGLKEGRRPRKILDVKMNNGVAVSKTVDTSYKRIEIFTYEELEDVSFDIVGVGIEKISSLFLHKAPLALYGITQPHYLYVDLKVSDDEPEILIKLMSNKDIIEEKKFHLKDMRWI
jgi:hypothetical protein